MIDTFSKMQLSIARCVRLHCSR